MERPETEGSSGKCPKCGYPLEAGTDECQVCGIIVSRYLARHPELRGGDLPPPIQRVAPAAARLEEKPVPSYEGRLPAREGRIEALLIPLPRNCSLPTTILHAGVLLILLYFSVTIWVAPIASNQAGRSFIHLVNLPFHEAGHLFFRPFGEFITSLGGTLGQFLVPLICCGAFLFYRFDNFAAAVCLWWIGEDFLDIAPYIDDARRGTLPLLGGNTGHSAPYGFHDWEYLLTETGLLNYDHHLARASSLAGTLVMSGALVWAGILIWRQFERFRR